MAMASQYDCVRQLQPSSMKSRKARCKRSRCSRQTGIRKSGGAQLSRRHRDELRVATGWGGERIRDDRNGYVLIREIDEKTLEAL
jgi:hypothetical protein